MLNNKKSRTPTTNRVLWITGLSCAACCAIPVAGILLGSSAIAGLSIYSGKMAALIALIGIAYLIIRHLVQKSGASCKLGGDCQPDKK